MIRTKSLIILIFYASIGFSIIVKQPEKCKKVKFEGVYKDIMESNKSDSPIISAFSFRSIANHHLDNNFTEFETDSVQAGDIIYMCHDFIRWFAKEVHPHIKHPYILYTGDTGDFAPNPKAMNMIYDPKLAAWFSRSMIFTNHKKFIQVPMGPTDLYFAHFWGEDSRSIFIKEMSENREKKHLLYMDFCARPHGDRYNIAKLFIPKEYCFTHMRFCDAETNPFGVAWDYIATPRYYRYLGESKFVISPLGYEVDCVRNWEAISLNCIPLIPRTFVDPIFYDLPVVFVDDWNSINKEFLENAYEEINNKEWNLEKIFFPYWENRILQAQKDIRAQGLSYASLEGSLFSQQELLEIFQAISQPQNRAMLMVGFLTGLRSCQINELFKKKKPLFLIDPYLKRKSYGKFSTYIDKRWEKLNPKLLDKFPASFKGDVLLDLTHFRSCVLFKKSDWTSSLDEDVMKIYKSMNPGGMIIGNSVNDPYVRHVLEVVQNRLSIEIHKQSFTWILKK